MDSGDIHRSLPLVEEVLELFRQETWRPSAERPPDHTIESCGSWSPGSCPEYNAIKAMEAAAIEEIKGIRRFMGVMDTMITVAPLFGIFGTVLGIISSFEMLGSAGIGPWRLPPASLALITTAAGLAIAILTIFPYNYFNHR